MNALQPASIVAGRVTDHLSQVRHNGPSTTKTGGARRLETTCASSKVPLRARAYNCLLYLRGRQHRSCFLCTNPRLRRGLQLLGAYALSQSWLWTADLGVLS